VFADALALVLLSRFFAPVATPASYPLSLHDALPISAVRVHHPDLRPPRPVAHEGDAPPVGRPRGRLVLPLGVREPVEAAAVESRSEEHTSELQSRVDLVCRLLLEKKKHKQNNARARE